MSVVLFWVIAVMILAACWRVVSSKNLLHSVLAAFVVLLGTAALYFLLNAEFLGIAQVLVYAGAVTILVLFVVMLTTAGPNYEISFENKVGPLMYLFTLLFFALLAFVISKIQWPFTGATVAQYKNVTDTLAAKIFLEYLLPFEVASVLLLAALVGAVVLARKE